LERGRNNGGGGLRTMHKLRGGGGQHLAPQHGPSRHER
jgi:hypothetical protein